MDEEMKENWPKNDLLVHKDRAIALDRALKFAVLFRKETFPNIQKLINSQGKELSAMNLKEVIPGKVQKENGISDEDLRWLANYLKHSNDITFEDPNDSRPA
jgi:hypothetical protein